MSAKVVQTGSLKKGLVKSIGMYGGSFDPVHFGHLRTALEVYQQLRLDEIRFIPSADPPHKEGPQASAADRINMLELAIAKSPGLIIDPREIQRRTTSYTFDTLVEMQGEFPQAELTLVIGTDQFSVFDTWHRWEELLGMANLAVMERPGEVLSDFAKSLVSCEYASKITLCQVTQLDISSTRIRSELNQAADIQFLVPHAVRQYISEHKLYQS